VSNIAQIPNGQKRQVKIIDTPSQSVRSSIQSVPEPIRVSVASLRNSRAKGTTMQVPSILQGDSLKRLLQGAAVGAIATIFIGFNWGGWVTGGTAIKLADERANTAVVAALTPICVEKFLQNNDAKANLAVLQKISSNWEQGDYLQKGGWATRPGATSSDYQLARACAEKLVLVKIAAQ
jgi:hypothetical protein